MKSWQVIPGIILPKQLEETESGWHLYMIQLDSKVLKKSRKEIFDEMRALNIGVHVHYIPVYWHPYYRELGYEKGTLPELRRSGMSRLLTLPIYPGMTDEDVEDVVGGLRELII